MVALVGRGSGFAIVPAADPCPRVARKYARQEPKAQMCVTSEYACTLGGRQSRPVTAIVTYRWNWTGLCVDAWDEGKGWGDA